MKGFCITLGNHLFIFIHISPLFLLLISPNHLSVTGHLSFSFRYIFRNNVEISGKVNVTISNIDMKPILDHFLNRVYFQTDHWSNSNQNFYQFHYL